jgi:UDP:flavonoid glycosyltransferase YjiC (YdhE family)
LRVLFTVRSGLGHLHPLIPIARAAQAAGHEVIFAASLSVASVVERAGFRCQPAGLVIDDQHVEDLVPEMRGSVGKERAAFYWRHIFAEHAPAVMIPALLEFTSVWHPDLIVRDDTEFSGCIVAERLDVPHAAVQTVAFRPHLYDLIREPLSQRRVEAGLPPDPDLAMPFRYLFLSPFPAGYLNPAVTLPSTTLRLRPVPFDRSGEEGLPEWCDRLPDRPTVYLTLGTVFNYRTDIVRTFLEGLRDEPVNLIVTVGRNQDPGQFGRQPEHVHIERYIPQTLLFGRCNLVITHGGSGTVMAALTHGVPMVIVPIAADQPDNAERCAGLGVAQVIPLAALSPERAVGAVREVLSQAHYRQAAERLRAEIAELPGPEYGVELLERLAVDKRPLLAG